MGEEEEGRRGKERAGEGREREAAYHLLGPNLQSHAVSFPLRPLDQGNYQGPSKVEDEG